MIRILLISTIIFTTGCATSVPYVPPYVAFRTAKYNRAYKEGLVEGIRLGEQQGNEKGYNRGYGEALYIGKILGKDSLMRVLQTVDKDMYSILMTRDYNCYKPFEKNLEEAHLAGLNEGLHKSQATAYEQGYKKGYQEAFDLITSINLGKGEIVNYPVKINSRLSIDYEKVVHLLFEIGDNENYASFAHFSNATREVHIEILGYLVRRLDANLTLTERSEVFQRYEEIHDKLAARHYQRYISLCNIRNRNYDQRAFYDYRHYSSADVFLDVIGMGISGVTDVVFTYAKSNPQFCATAGFEIMGHITELIMDEIMLPVHDLLIKQALKLDYDLKTSVFQQSVRDIIFPQVATTRTHSKTIKKIVPGYDFTAEVEMEIVTIVALGFEVDNLTLEVNHSRQSFNINIGNSPRFLHAIYQGYTIKKVSCSVFTTYPGGQKNFSISKRALEDIFEANRDAPQSLDICTKNLSNIEFEHIIPSLVKVMDPIISLPTSCYQVNLNVADYGTRKVINAKCK